MKVQRCISAISERKPLTHASRHASLPLSRESVADLTFSKLPQQARTVRILVSALPMRVNLHLERASTGH